MEWYASILYDEEISLYDFKLKKVTRAWKYAILVKAEEKGAEDNTPTYLWEW